MPSLLPALAPVREALLASAQADADREVAAAEAQVREILARADARARDIVDEARRQGGAEAAAASAVTAGRMRRGARAVVLAAQRAAHENLVVACREAVGSLRTDPAWPQVQSGLSAVARAAVGDDAVVTATPSGVVAAAGSRRAELTLEGLAERMLERLSDEVPGLWAP